jgi:hypothetical protein
MLAKRRPLANMPPRRPTMDPTIDRGLRNTDASVAKLVDAPDSKSGSQKECWFESGQGHHLTFPDMR